MFHFSEQWRIKSEREALIDPASEFVGDVKIIRKTSFKPLYDKGVKVSRYDWHRGVKDIENYSNKFEDVSGKTEHRAYHYFDSEYKMWCTEYVKITYLQGSSNETS